MSISRLAEKFPATMDKAQRAMWSLIKKCHKAKIAHEELNLLNVKRPRATTCSRWLCSDEWREQKQSVHV